MKCSRWGGKGEGGGKEKERKGREGRDREGWEGNEGKGRTKRKGREGQGRKGREYIWIRMLIMVLVLMLERTPTFHNNKSLTFSLISFFSRGATKWSFLEQITKGRPHISKETKRIHRNISKYSKTFQNISNYIKGFQKGPCSGAPLLVFLFLNIVKLIYSFAHIHIYTHEYRYKK